MQNTKKNRLTLNSLLSLFGQARISLSRIVFSFTLLIFSISALLATGNLSAQPADAVKKDSSAEVKKLSVDEIINQRYERIYVPEKSLAEYWSAVKPGVLLDKKEFETLLMQAQKTKALNAGQPLGIVVEQIEYRVKVVGDILHIDARCQLSKFKSGWAILSLPINNVSVIQAKLAGKPAPLGIYGKTSQVSLVDDFVGKRELTLSLTTPIRRLGTDEIVSFSVFPNAAAKLEANVPKDRVLEVNGSILGDEEQHRKPRIVKTFVGGKGNVQLRFSDAVGESLNDSLVFAQTMYAIGVERDSVNWKADCQIDLYGKRFNRLEFSVPSNLEIADVQAAGLQSWDLEKEAKRKDHTKITLIFRETIPQQMSVSLQGVQLLKQSNNWAVAPLKLYGVTSHTGSLGISAAQEMRLKTIETKGIRPSTRSWNPTAKFIQLNNVHFYDLWAEDFTYRLSTLQTSGEVQAAVTNILDVDEIETRLTSTITLQTLFSPLFELNLEVPAQWSPEKVRQENGEIDWQNRTRQAGVHRLRLPITPPLKPGEKRTISLTVRLNRESGQQDAEDQKAKRQMIELPEVKIEGVNILEGSFVVRANGRLDVIPSNIQGMDPAFLGIPNERFGYRYQDSRIGGHFEVIRKPTRFNSTTTQIVSVEEETISLRHQVMLEIAGGGLREMTAQLSTNGGAKNTLVKEEFQTLGNLQIVDQQRTKTKNGTQWKLKFDRYVTGKVPLFLTVTLPREKKKTEQLSPVQYPVPELTFEAAQLQEQFLAFVAKTDQRLSVSVKDKTGATLEPIDPANLPMKQSNNHQRIIAGYHAIKPGNTVVVSEDRFDSSAIPTAIGHNLSLTSLLLESGQFQQQATLSFAAVGVQSLMVRLPENAVLWSTMIDGVPVTARKLNGGFVISLTNSELQTPSGQRAIRVLYGFENNTQELGSFSTQVLPSPEFAVLNGAGEQQPLRILKTEWQIHHAPDSTIEPLDSGVEQAGNQASSSWLSRLIENVFQTGWKNALWNLFLGSIILIIPAGLVSIYRKNGWKLYSLKSRISPTMVAGALVFTLAIYCCIALLFPQIQGARNAASRGNDQAVTTQEYPGYATKSASEPVGSFGNNETESSATPFSTSSPSPEGFGERMRQGEQNKSRREPKKSSDILAAEQRGQKAGEKNIEGANANPFAPRDELAKNVPGHLPIDEKPARWGMPLTSKPVGLAGPPEIPHGGKDSGKDSDANANHYSKGEADGLLSLQLGLQIPENLTITRLSRFGEQAGQTGLRLRYFSQTAVNRLRWLIVAAVVLIFWLLRTSNNVTKFSWVAVIFGVPLAAMGIVSEMFLPLLEGMLLGATLGLLIWLGIVASFYCQSMCGSACRLWGRWKNKTATVAGLFILLAMQAATPSNAIAKDEVKEVTKYRTLKNSEGKTVVVPYTVSSSTTTPLTTTRIKPQPPVVSKKLPLVFPYSDKKSPLAAERVFVPKAEYLKLWKQTHPEEAIDAAPVPFLLHEASYVAEMIEPSEASKEYTIAVKARFVIRNFRDQSQIVRLPLGPVVMESIEINGKKTVGTLVGKNQPAVLLPASKLSLVDVQFRLPANSVGAAGSFSLLLKRVASGSFSFLLPAKETEIRVNDGKVPFQIVTRDKKQYAEIVVAPGGNYSFSWQPKMTTTQMKFLSCESLREVQMGDTGAELHYSFEFNIAQGTFSEVEFQLPENVKLKSLAGEDLAGWQVLEKGKLRVLLKKAVERRTVISLFLFTPLEITKEEQEFPLPDVIPQNVTREIGSWAINWGSAITANFTMTKGVRQMKNDQLKRFSKTIIVSSPQRVYRFSSRPLDLRLNVSRKRAESTAYQYTLVDVQQHKTHIATFAKIIVQGEPRLSVDFELPRKLQIIELTATDLSDWFVTPGENNRSTLTVLFSSPQMGNVEVVARGHIQQEAGSVDSVSFSGLQMKGTDRTQSYLGIGATEILAVSIEAMDGWQTMDPKSLPAALRKMATFPIRLGLKNSVVKPLPVTISLSREQAQIKASSVSLVAVTNSSIDYGVSMQWILSKAATDRFSFVGPKWFENRIEFQSPGIRQVTTKTINKHETLWTIETREPQNKKFFANAAITLPYPEDRTVSTPRLKFVSVEEDENGGDVLTRLDIESHYAILVNLAREPLSPISDHARLLVQKKELPMIMPDSLLKQAMEIVRVTNKMTPTWKLKKLGKQSSPPATVTISQLMSVLDEQGSWRTLARYKVKNRRRQFLPVVLPKDSELLSVIVANRPAKAMKRKIGQQEVNLIPLPPAGEADLAIEVRVVLQGNLGSSLTSAWGVKKVALPRPSIVSPEDSAEFGIPVMYTTWELSTPEDLAIRRNSKSNMTVSNRRDLIKLSLKSQLSEISELSRIIASKSNSFKQRSLAVGNLKTMQEKVETVNELFSLDLNSDGTMDRSLQRKQQQVFEEAAENVSRFTDEAAGKPIEASPQSFGRGYIQNNNTAICNFNCPTIPGKDSHGEMNDSSSSHTKLPTRINAPAIQERKGKGNQNRKREDEKKQSIQKPSFKRESLLKENFRQNTLLQQEAQKESLLRKKLEGQLYDIDKNVTLESAPFGLDSLITLGKNDNISADDLMLGSSLSELRKDFTSDRFSTNGKWTATGGLSLLIDLPTYEQTMVFSKVEGKPELIIEIHSRSLLSKAIGYGYGLLALLVVLWLLSQMKRFAVGENLPQLYALLTLLGLGCFILLPSPLATAGLLVALIASVLYAERVSRKFTKTA